MIRLMNSPHPDRRQRSRLRNYGEQIDALGLTRWVAFKVQRLRSRRSPAGQQFTVKTPLAVHPLDFRAKTSDTNVFSQIFLHREYRCLDDLENVGLIIDCGANVGYSTAYLLTRFPDSHVIAIEPESSNFALLQQNVAPYGNRCTTIEAGVWSSAVGLVVSQGRTFGGAEWAFTVRPAEDGEQPMVHAVDLGSVLHDSGYDRISILKVDIEGSEDEVFRANVDPWLDKVDNIVIELHGETCRSVVMNAISGLGFELSQSEELTVCKRPVPTV